MRFIKYLNRLRLGHKPLFVEYEYDFAARWGDIGNEFIRQTLERSQPIILKNLSSLESLLPLIESLSKQSAPAPRVNWENHFIPALDAMSLMWAAARSKSMFIEIESGNSTLFIKRSLEYHKRETRLISIDPNPRIEISSLCDRIIRAPLEKADLSIFDQLQSGDVLFVDSSHRSFTNSDVTVVMLDILPRIKPGVLVGFHDIFLPFDYLESWSGRFYNEQYLLACYILANPNYFNLQLCNFWVWHQKAHIKPLAKAWDFLGAKIRDRRPSAFWGVKN